MIAVTVVTPSYRHLEKEAVRRVKKYTGLPVKVIRCKDKDGFMKKLELDKECGRQRVMFFDCDWYALRTFDPKSWCDQTWLAVHDSAVFNPHAFPNTDCGLFNMDKLRYFNSGFFICNLALRSHRQVFQIARRLRNKVLNKKMSRPVDVTDQFYLNLAAQQLNVNLSLVPAKFNVYLLAAAWGQLQFIPRDIVGIHAAGVKLEDKAEVLSLQTKVFGYDICKMHPEAVAWEQARIFDMR